jgi:hypothetical protein
MKDLDWSDVEADAQRMDDELGYDEDADETTTAERCCDIRTDSEIKQAIVEQLKKQQIDSTEEGILIRDPRDPADPGDWITSDQAHFGSWYVDGPIISILVEG